MLEVFEVLRSGAARLIARHVGSCSPTAALGRRHPGRYRLVYRNRHVRALRVLVYAVDLDGFVRRAPTLRVARRSPAPPTAAVTRAPTKVTAVTVTARPTGETRVITSATKDSNIVDPPHHETATSPWTAVSPAPCSETVHPTTPVPQCPAPAERPPPPGYDDVLPRRLRLLLKTAGISQAELARVAVLNVSHVNDLCTGRRRDPSIRTVVALSRALACSCDWLAGRVDRGPIAAEVRMAFLNAGGRLRATWAPCS